MTHPDPQAAPPETDLPLLVDLQDLPDEQLGSELWFALHGMGVDHNDPRYKRMAAGIAETERRLARPDALREKVMDAIDDSLTDMHGRVIPGLSSRVKAAVAAVLEGDDNAS